MVKHGRITFTLIVKCPATTMLSSLEGLQGEQDSWRAKDLKEILLRWPDRLIMEMLAIFDFDYDLAQQNACSGELKELYDQFHDKVKKLLS